MFWFLFIQFCFRFSVAQQYSRTFEVTPPPRVRDVYMWPYSNISIWNLPIGNGATYMPSGIAVTADTVVYADPSMIFLNVSEPVTNIYYNSAGWTGASRCDPTPPTTLVISTPFPSKFILTDTPQGNYPAIFLQKDKVTLRQGQPLARCDLNRVPTIGEVVDYTTSNGDNPSIYGPGFYGAHGGSGLSAFGGVLRFGELMPDANGVVHPVRHALQINLQASKYYYNTPSMTYANCFLWPAIKCDGSVFKTMYGGTNKYVSPGSLLAIDPSIDINKIGLASPAGLAVAWTLQNYGGYIVEDAVNDAISFATEQSISGRYIDQFYEGHGYTFENGYLNENDFTRDFRMLFNKLSVVTNWNAASYATVAASNGALGVGGGAPRQAWAPPLGNPKAPTIAATARPTFKVTASPSNPTARPSNPSAVPSSLAPSWKPVTLFPSPFTFQVTDPPPKRDALGWPFSNVSIWNLPIGNNAAFKSAGIAVTSATAIGGSYSLLFLNASQPITNVYKIYQSPNYVTTCDAASPPQVLLSVPFPSSFYVTNKGLPASFLLSDGTTVRQGPDFRHCDAQHPVVIFDTVDPKFVYGQVLYSGRRRTESPSIYGPGFYGAHGGSGLSALGGSIRLGEFIPNSAGVVKPVRHALKVKLQALKYFFRDQNTNANNCFLWPALRCGGDGSSYGGSDPNLRPGSLLALDRTVNIYDFGLTSTVGLAVAWTLQNYGAYLIGDSGWDGAIFEVEYSTSGDYLIQFQKAYGFSFQNGYLNENNWTKDIRKMLNKLSVVTNWNEASYATVATSNGALGVGGGAPKQAWAPAFSIPNIIVAPTKASTTRPTFKVTASPSNPTARPSNPTLKPSSLAPSSKPVMVPSPFTFQVTDPPLKRDALVWPFSNVSIWNLPIGNNAALMSAGIAVTSATAISSSQTLLFLNASQPITNIYKSPSGATTCDAASPPQVLLSVPFPSSFYATNTGQPATFLYSDKRTVRQGFNFYHCDAQHPVAIADTVNPNSIYGQVLTEISSIYGPGFYGAHGGSGLSAFGGSIRLGEFIPNSAGVVKPVRHALKVNLQGAQYFFKDQNTNYNNCFLWPALRCGGTGSSYGGSNPNLRPGSLLVLDSTINIYSLGLKSTAGLAVAWTLQNYGTYIVGDSGWNGVLFQVERSTSGEYTSQFQQAYGYTFQNGYLNENNWTQDVRNLLNKLSVVTNWNAASYATVAASNGALGVGGGAPRQAWAPPFGNPNAVAAPTRSPSRIPSTAPRPAPTFLSVSRSPSVSPTKTKQPSSAPTARPSCKPSVGSTSKTTTGPTRKPTTGPTSKPTTGPTSKPTVGPTTRKPFTRKPITSKPTVGPTRKPTNTPSFAGGLLFPA